MKNAPVGRIGKAAFAGALWMVMALLAGCAAHIMVPDQETPWHMQPSGAYDTGEGKVFYGIGKAAPLRNRALQRVSADNQARLEMTRLLDRYSTVLFHTGTPADDGAAVLPEEFEPALKSLVHQAMQRAIVTDHWADPDQGRLLALCRLNLVDFEAALGAHRGLRADVRAAMLTNLEWVHDQLSQVLLENQ